jgi:signal transduction histidine kinase
MTDNPVWWTATSSPKGQRYAEPLELRVQAIESFASSADISAALANVTALLSNMLGDSSAILLLDGIPGVASASLIDVADEPTARELAQLLHDIPLRYGEGGGIVAQALATGEITLLTKDKLDAVSGPGYRYVELLGLKAVLVVPLIFQNRPLGVINILSSKVKTFTARQRLFLKQIALSTSIAIENARMLHVIQKQQLQQREFVANQITTQEQEQKRIALDIHDGTLQSLIVSLQQIRELSNANAEPVKRIEASLAKAIGELRSTIRGLRPPVLDVFGLVRALATELDEFEQRQEIATSLEVEGQAGVSSPEVDITLVRILQEALANVAKHAEASSVVVRLAFGAASTTMDILDDGVGLTSGRRSRDGIGVLGMIERAMAIGGELIVADRPEGGCRVSVLLPLKDDGAAACQSES